MNKKSYWFYLFSIYISFYAISCLFLMLDIFKENAEMYTVLGVSVLLSLIGLLFFTPAIILVSLIEHKVKHKAVSNVISFGIVYLYGYIFFIESQKEYSDFSYYYIPIFGSETNFYVSSIILSILFIAVYNLIIGR